MKQLKWIVATLAITASAHASPPTDARRAPGEDPAKEPAQVCREIVLAARSGQVDRILGRISTYGRVRLGWWQKIALSFAKTRIAKARCQENNIDGDRALVRVESASEGSSQVPFVREGGYWRFDVERWNLLREQGQAPQP